MTIFIVFTLVILPMLITIFIRMEGEKPTVKTELPTLILSSGEEFQINIEDHNRQRGTLATNFINYKETSRISDKFILR